MPDRLKGKVALITGGTSGIGAATAELFVKEGATVMITGRSVEKGQALADSLGPNASYREADVMEEAAIADCIFHTSQTHGRLDILFNNAGGPVGAPLDQLTQEHIDYGVRLLLSSAMLGTKYAVDPMKANGGGCIINNSSIAGLRYRQGGFTLLGPKSSSHPLHPHVWHRTWRAQYTRQFDLARGYRYPDFLGRIPARQHTQ